MPLPRRADGTLLLIAALALGACSTQAQERRGGRGDRAATVGFVTVRPTSAPVPVTLAGRVVAAETSEVRPQVNGLVQRIAFRPGGYVRAGQPLFQIDSSLYRAATAQAQANLASAEANAAAASARAGARASGARCGPA
mgnify:CR=1 FL=1